MPAYALNLYPSPNVLTSFIPVHLTNTEKTNPAMGILAEMLEFEPMPVTEIEAVMARKGIGKRTVQQAGKLLGVVQGYENGQPVWGL